MSAPTPVLVIEPMTTKRALPAQSLKSGLARGREGRARRQDFMDSPLGVSPWRKADAVQALTRLALALIGMVVCYFGVSSTATFQTEVIWIGITIGVNVLAVVASATWLLTGFGNLTRERRQIYAAVQALYELDEAPEAEPSDRAPEVLVWGTGMQRAHLATCAVARGKDVQSVTAEEASSRGLKRCGMCQP